MPNQLGQKQPVVMIVDDEPMVLEVSSLMIESLGFEVHSFSSPSEALSAFKEHPALFDLAVIDMMMPGYTGKQLFLKLKEINPAIKAIISSGYQMNESDKSLLDLGISGFLNKPFTMDALRERLNEFLVPK